MGQQRSKVTCFKTPFGVEWPMNTARKPRGKKEAPLEFEFEESETRTVPVDYED
jgi:hypothetical protein